MKKPIDDGGAAFPIVAYGVPKDGMTLRDWFAGQALAGLMAQYGTFHRADNLAPIALQYADAMIAARKGSQ